MDIGLTKKVENLKVCINFIKDQKNIKNVVIGVENSFTKISEDNVDVTV